MRRTFTPFMIYKGMFDIMSSTSYQYKASPEFMEMDWKLYLGNRRLPSKATGKQKNVFLQIWRYMGREVKVVLLHLKIIMYQRSDKVYDEGRRETD